MKDRGFVNWIIIIVLATALVAILSWDPNIKSARRAERKAQQEVDAKPVKFSEGGGCETWRFKPDERWIYFVKCPSVEPVTTLQQECHSGAKRHLNCQTREVKTINKE